MRSLIPIETIAEGACINDIGDSTQKYFTAMIEWMAEGFREMHLFMSDEISVKTEVLRPDRIVNMPCDFIEPTKVALQMNGRIAVLWRNYGSFNNRQRPTNNTEDIRYISAVIKGEIIPDDLIPFYNYMGTNILEGYSTGINPKGFYDFDRTNGTIQLGSFWPDDAEVVVEYKSDGVSNGLRLVPSEWAKAIRHYGLKQYSLRKKDWASLRTHEREYDQQWYMIKDMYVNQPIDYQARVFQNTPRQTINNLM